MIRTFRLRTYYRNVGLICLTFFIAAIVAVIILAIAVDGPILQRVAGAVLQLMVWVPMSLLSLWVLLAQRKFRLFIQEKTVEEQGVLLTTSIDLSSINKVEWRCVPLKGSLVLRSDRQKLTVHFANFLPDESLWLIRHFRAALPPSIQQEWPLFCKRIALPMRDGERQREPGPGEVKLTRRTWDLYLIPIVSVSAISGLLLWWFGISAGLMTPILPLGLLLLFRFGTPKNGIVTKRLSAIPGAVEHLLFMVGWGTLGMVGLVLWKLLQPMQPIVGVLGFVGWLIMLLPQIIRSHRREKEARQLESKATVKAVSDWEAGERSLVATAP